MMGAASVRKVARAVGRRPAELFQEIKLEEKLAVAVAWCDEQGDERDEIVEAELVEEFADALGLKKLEKARLLEQLEKLGGGGGGASGISFNLKLPGGKIHHIFISYYAKEMDAVF